jgi:hypothetical protein
MCKIAVELKIYMYLATNLDPSSVSFPIPMEKHIGTRKEDAVEKSLSVSCFCA